MLEFEDFAKIEGTFLYLGILGYLNESQEWRSNRGLEERNCKYRLADGSFFLILFVLFSLTGICSQLSGNPLVSLVWNGRCKKPTWAQYTFTAGPEQR